MSAQCVEDVKKKLTGVHMNLANLKKLNQIHAGDKIENAVM